jgi:hypothetical protein
VAIVGSGASVLGNSYGTVIENQDIVVRINRGYPYERYRQDVGSRTDIWAHGMGSDRANRLKMNKLFCDRKFSTYSWWDHSHEDPEIAGLANHIFLPPQFSLTAAKACGGKPLTTGSDFIHFLVTGTECAELHIFGLDFYSTGYWFIEEDDSIIPTVISSTEGQVHNVNLEQEFITRLLHETDKRIYWYK